MKNMFLILVTIFFTVGCSEENIQKEDNLLLGSWKLISFVNQSTSSTLLASDFPSPNEVTLNFNVDLKFTGSTVRNNFTGSYSFNEKNKELVLIDFATTDVNQTKLGNLFYKGLNLIYNQQTGNSINTYEIRQGNILRIYSSEKDYMTFEKQL